MSGKQSLLAPVMGESFLWHLGPDKKKCNNQKKTIREDKNYESLDLTVLFSFIQSAERQYRPLYGHSMVIL